MFYETLSSDTIPLISVDSSRGSVPSTCGTNNTLGRTYGIGVRALVDHILPPHQSQITRAVLQGRLITTEEYSRTDDVSYVIDLRLEDDGPHEYHGLRDYWTGRVNHTPPGRANTRFVGTTLVQIRFIRAGEEVTVAYGWEYWWYACYRVDHEEYDSAASTLSSLPAGSVERDALRLIYRELCVAASMDLYERVQYWRPGVSGGSVVCGW